MSFGGGTRRPPNVPVMFLHSSPPSGRPELVRAILLSLACAQKSALDQLSQVSGQDIDVIHIVGGGARNKLLCKLTADVAGVPVIAGPAEASGIGNLLVQLRAGGAFASRQEMRSCVASSFALEVYEPCGSSADYERYRSLTMAGQQLSDTRFAPVRQ